MGVGGWHEQRQKLDLMSPSVLPRRLPLTRVVCRVSDIIECEKRPSARIPVCAIAQSADCVGRVGILGGDGVSPSHGGMGAERGSELGIL